MSHNILNHIGNTPLVEIRRLNPNPHVRILAKLEYLNPDPHDSVLVTWFGQLPVHLTRISRADDLFDRHAGKLLKPTVGPLTAVTDFTLAPHATERDWSAAPARVQARRQTRERRAVVDLVVGGMADLPISFIRTVLIWLRGVWWPFRQNIG